jgi:osmoprotectant transport system ATP-binding protein
MNRSVKPVVEFRDVSLELDGGPRILSHVSLDVRAGEVLVLLGRSGSGKTTTLKLINRLLEPSGGAVLVGGKATTDWEPTRLRRQIGYVIQDVGLFPHYTVARNVALVPTLEAWDEERKRHRVSELLELVGLPPSRFAARYPSQLSGGQRQRVGVARALAADPPLLLMDEPFGALDPLTRLELQRELKQLQARLGKTIVFVTHDIREALLLATRIAFFHAGELIFVGEPGLFLAAKTAEVAAFVDALSDMDLGRRSPGVDGGLRT